MSQLHIDTRRDLDRRGLVPVTEERFEAYKGLKDSYQALKEYLNKNGLSIDNVHESTSWSNTFWYIDTPVFIPLFTLNIEDLEMHQLPQRVEAQKGSLDKYWREEKYETFFGFVEKKFSFDLFMQLHTQIPVFERYDVFIDLYTRNDYGFQQLDEEVVHRILAPRKGQRGKRHFDIDKDGFVTIFRGMQDKSAPPETAYSWTTDITKAEYFATRFNSIYSALYTAKVHYTKIVDFITTRNESEVIILPEDLTSIQDMGYLNYDDALRDTLYIEGYSQAYTHYTNQLKDNWFHNPTGIHGVKHIKRVLMNTLIMSHLDKLSEQDKLLLSYASIYHDIGRTNDDYDLLHGKQSVDKMIHLNLPTKGLSQDERQILEFLMEYHAKPDKTGLRGLKQADIKDKERALDLFNRFKDCDGLDRVRLGDLETKYLRTDTAKKMVLIAHQLLRNIK